MRAREASKTRHHVALKIFAADSPRDAQDLLERLRLLPVLDRRVPVHALTLARPLSVLAPEVMPMFDGFVLVGVTMLTVVALFIIIINSVGVGVG